MFAVWVTLLSLALATYALATSRPELGVPFVIIGNVGLGAVFLQSIRRTRDLLNPLALILFLGLVRFTATWALVTFGGDPQVLLFQLLGITPRGWQLGELLAITGFLSLALGWLLVSGREASHRAFSRMLPPAAIYSSLAGMMFGSVSLLLFVSRNASSVSSVISEGTFRGLTIRQGTGFLFYAALALPACSVVLSAYLIERGRRWLSLVPVSIAMLGLFVLGGRARASLAFFGGFLLLWYGGGRRVWLASRSQRRRRTLLIVAGSCIGLIVLYVGALYRGSATLEPATAINSVRGLQAYLQQGFFLDIGHLHALAAATEIGPGVLHGQTFIGDLAFPLAPVLGIREVSSGMYLVDQTIGLPDRQWGLDPSLMGDAYLNFGVLGVVVTCGLLGMATKAIYASFRAGRLHAALYVLAVSYVVRIMFESFDKWGEALTVMSFALAAVYGSWLLSGRRPRHPPPFRQVGRTDAVDAAIETPR